MGLVVWAFCITRSLSRMSAATGHLRCATIITQPGVLVNALSLEPCVSDGWATGGTHL